MVFRSEQQEIPEVKPLLEKKKRKPPTKNERLAIVVVFLLTIVLSAFFYLKAEFPALLQRITAPLIISTIPQEEKFDPSPVLGEIKNLTANLRGTYGVYIYRFSDSNEYGIYQNEIFPAASLMKLPVMLLVYLEAERGNLKLDDYRELVKVMGKRSDNAVYNRLVKYFGRDKIQELIASLGMEKTFLAKDDTTPADIGLFFRKLYQGNREELLNFLTDTIFEDRIPAGVSEGVRVAHKIGTEIGVFSDAGIVFAEDPFVLVIMSKNARESEAKEILPKIAKAVWEWETVDSGQ